MPTPGNTQLARSRRRLRQALRRFTYRHSSPVEIRVWPGPIEKALICVKPTITRKWDYDGWLRRGVLLVTFDSIQPTGGLRPALAAIAALTRQVVFIGDLDPLDLAMFVKLESVIPPAVRLIYGGMDDEWLAKEKASRITPDATPYIRMPGSELSLWRALREAHPSITTTIGPKSTAFLDSGLKIEVEGAVQPDWHGETMLKLAFRRAFGTDPRATRAHPGGNRIGSTGRRSPEA